MLMCMWRNKKIISKFILYIRVNSKKEDEEDLNHLVRIAIIHAQFDRD